MFCRLSDGGHVSYASYPSQMRASRVACGSGSLFVGRGLVLRVSPSFGDLVVCAV